MHILPLHPPSDFTMPVINFYRGHRPAGVSLIVHKNCTVLPTPCLVIILSLCFSSAAFLLEVCLSTARA